MKERKENNRINDLYIGRQNFLTLIYLPNLYSGNNDDVILTKDRYILPS